jgi:hypothetical protein
MIALCLMAAATTCVAACGDDDDDSASSGDTAAAEAPAPTRAFVGLSTAPRPGSITGTRSGTAREFATQKEAQGYADEVAASGSDKTTTVGTVVFQASTQDDADFFADAYEGG